MYECACVCVLCVLVYTDFGCFRGCQLRVRCLEYCLFTLRPPHHCRSPPETCNDDDDFLSTTTMRSERTHTHIFIRSVYYWAPYYKNTHSARTHTHSRERDCGRKMYKHAYTGESFGDDWLVARKSDSMKAGEREKIVLCVLRCAHVCGSILLVVDIKKRLHNVKSMPTKRRLVGTCVLVYVYSSTGRCAMQSKAKRYQRMRTSWHMENAFHWKWKIKSVNQSQ